MIKRLGLILLVLLFSFACVNKTNTDPTKEENPDEPGIVDDDPVKEHVCHEFETKIIGDYICMHEFEIQVVCKECGKIKESTKQIKEHAFVVDEKDPTCDEDGYEKRYCIDCGLIDYSYSFSKTGHDYHYQVTKEMTEDALGEKEFVCTKCHDVIKTVNFIPNGFRDHGKLSVSGRDLVDKNGEPFQLIGLSTHGLQWFGRYVTFDTLDAIHNEFYNNVFRLSLYTSEGGYCECTPSMKEKLYKTVSDGIKIALECDCYVIVDWHMLGAENANDKNPLYYLDEAKEFFGRISSEFKDYDNVLYEIMNEPCGSTTWADCKEYANEIIPIIRQNTDAIILVGNPKWSADLVSVMNDPLVGYENIMYTFHFYANDSYDQKRLTNAYDNNFPVFVTEHGGMEASGDGAMDYTCLTKWYKAMDERNISYVAWNISNSKGSASIIKYGDSTTKNFSDSHLKEWGIYYKNHVREEMGIAELLNN